MTDPAPVKPASEGISYKQKLVRSLRTLGLLPLVEQIAMTFNVMRTRGDRAAFQKETPGFDLPPPGLAYDAFGSVDPVSYQTQGMAHAQLIARLIRRHHPAPQIICDWGCGPLRVLRHMEQHFDSGTKFVGLDYNPRTIDWARRTFPQFDFRVNGLAPPLPLENKSVDVVYAISVFTHLSEALNHAFLADIRRCLRPGGILIATTHGDRYRERLLPAERALYDAGEFVVRGNVQEGKRLFVSFHNPTFARRMFGDWAILEHNETDEVPAFNQDHWVVLNGSRPVAPETPIGLQKQRGNAY